MESELAILKKAIWDLRDQGEAVRVRLWDLVAEVEALRVRLNGQNRRMAEGDRRHTIETKQAYRSGRADRRRAEADQGDPFREPTGIAPTRTCGRCGAWPGDLHFDHCSEVGRFGMPAEPALKPGECYVEEDDDCYEPHPTNELARQADR